MADEDGPTEVAPAEAPDEAAEEQATVEVVDTEEEARERSGISEPGKLMRIAVMLREMQEEVRRADTDERGRELIRRIHHVALEQMEDVLSGDLREELRTLTLPFGEDAVPSESEIRISQAQLIGWLEGLFQGIQAALYSQQVQARQQLEQMRPRGLRPGQDVPPPGQGRGTGQYL